MPKNHPQLLISVILPVLDAADDIEALFSSIQAQKKIDKKAIEVIVVNDGSTDNTLQKVKEQQYRLKAYYAVRIVNHKERKGLVITRFDGVKTARGRFITFIDKKGRPDNDYLYSFISKGKNIIIGNPYVNKSRSIWGRVLALIRIKLYFPYFNHPFKDIMLDTAAYAKFKNKGGGGSMFVLRNYYLQIAKDMPIGVHVNDDTLFVQKLTEIEPVLKTASPKLEYINRTGFYENIVHLYNRGPKFVDFYARPGSRFFLPIAGLVVFIIVNIALIFVAPLVIFYELLAFIGLTFLIALYLSQDVADFFASILILPIAAVSFSAGTLRGLILKLAKRY